MDHERLNRNSSQQLDVGHHWTALRRHLRLQDRGDVSNFEPNIATFLEEDIKVTIREASGNRGKETVPRLVEVCRRTGETVDGASEQGVEERG